MKKIPFSGPERLLNYEGLSEATGVAVATLKRLKKEGMPSYKVGGSIRFRLSEVLDYFNKE